MDLDNLLYKLTFILFTVYLAMKTGPWPKTGLDPTLGKQCFRRLLLQLLYFVSVRSDVIQTSVLSGLWQRRPGFPIVGNRKNDWGWLWLEAAAPTSLARCLAASPARETSSRFHPRGLKTTSHWWSRSLCPEVFHSWKQQRHLSYIYSRFPCYHRGFLDNLSVFHSLHRFFRECLFCLTYLSIYWQHCPPTVAYWICKYLVCNCGSIRAQLILKSWGRYWC